MGFFNPSNHYKLHVYQRPQYQPQRSNYLRIWLVKYLRVTLKVISWNTFSRSNFENIKQWKMRRRWWLPFTVFCCFGFFVWYILEDSLFRFTFVTFRVFFSFLHFVKGFFVCLCVWGRRVKRCGVWKLICIFLRWGVWVGGPFCRCTTQHFPFWGSYLENMGGLVTLVCYI